MEKNKEIEENQEARECTSTNHQRKHQNYNMRQLTHHQAAQPETTYYNTQIEQPRTSTSSDQQKQK